MWDLEFNVKNLGRTKYLSRENSVQIDYVSRHDYVSDDIISIVRYHVYSRGYIIEFWLSTFILFVISWVCLFLFSVPGIVIAVVWLSIIENWMRRLVVQTEQNNNNIKYCSPTLQLSTGVSSEPIKLTISCTDFIHTEADCEVTLSISLSIGACWSCHGWCGPVKEWCRERCCISISFSRNCCDLVEGRKVYDLDGGYWK